MESSGSVHTELDKQNIPEPPQKKLKKNDDDERVSRDKVVDVVGTGSREIDVGITEYVSDHESFTGIIKQRFSDFLVNEIALNGEVTHLTNLSKPIPETDKVVSSDLTDEQLESLKHLEEEKDLTANVLIKVGEDKEARTRIHKTISQTYSGLRSSTETIDGIKYIQVKVGKDTSRSNNWPKDKGEYCHFVMYKENRDTMNAVGAIASCLRMKPGVFQYAGTKDKRGKTVQKISAKRVRPERLFGLNKVLSNIKLGNFSYEKDRLQLGDLAGNHFTVVLRNCTGKEDQISKAMKSLSENGFINYFGMQRFGTSSIPTHHVGRALLHSDWSKAIDLILTARGDTGEHRDLIACREEWTATKNAESALNKLGRLTCVESHLLSGLCKYEKNDLVHALSMIPRNTRTMYVHSYQSYVWNNVVSRRIREHGLRLAVGDLVLPVAMEIGNDPARKEKPEPVVVTKENLEQYTIHNVVLPLPGFDVIYPDNVKSWYEELFEKDELNINTLKHKVKDYSLSGSYRFMMVKPSNLSWKMFAYDDVAHPLVLSDIDRLNEETEPVSVEGGKYKALMMEFSLPSSTYATMTIREVLRTDTSAAYQATLNTT
ncbi:pseudouridylate synthase 7 homolog [Tubulanus polymorphus]|uniref:pseudouridylate synthase 7 homolog n=1 Tax=Tubulanus polymorphus TaxID=672921 RepID=UPI003DA4B9C8